MSDKDKKKRAGGINPVVAGVAGAVVGGLAAAGAMVLGDEEKREKIGDAFSNAKDKTMDYVEGVRQAALDKKEEIADKMEEGKEKVMDKAEDIKEVLTED